jgi:eukaryotic-like serine/threonine-protein kinase
VRTQIQATARLQGDGATALGEGSEGRLVLDRYRLVRRLGAGGFGIVWLAVDERLQRQVAVKVLPREGERSPAARGAAREARAAARLNHPGIVALYELAADEHDLYLVSELVRGRTLAELERERALSDRDVARIGAALCDALDHAHARGVIHRDVKPGNVMVLAEPAAGQGFAKLADFGVAHLASGEPLTRTGDVVGTLAYMAPEQAEGVRVTPACDVYSLALTLYEAWTGSNPVRAASPAATARQMGRPLPSLRRRRRDLPPELCDAIDDSLEADPGQRPSVVELAQELRDAEPDLSEEGGLVEPGTRMRVGLASAERRLMPLMAIVGSGLSAGLLVLAALELLGPSPPVSSATAAAATAVAVALLPRAGWITAAVGVCGWLASPGADRPGTALVLLFALAPVPLLLPRAGRLWSAPALAPLLGAIGLAPAFVAVAGLAGSAWRRAGLAGAGFLWLAVAEILTGDVLLFGGADGTGQPEAWRDSLSGALTHGAGPLITSAALAPLLVWAGFAVALPFAVRGRSLGLDLAGGAVWAAALVAAHAGLGDLLAGTTELDQPRGAVAGTILGAAAAAAAMALVPRGEPVPQAPPATGP